jgi:hypothetical protein
VRRTIEDYKRRKKAHDEYAALRTYAATRIASVWRGYMGRILAAERRQELLDFTKCIAGSPERLNALCHLFAIDGAGVDPVSCQKVSKDTLREVLAAAAHRLLSGQMKVNGKKDNWNNGCFGSRWFDMDAERFGVDYVRAAFYSKKHYKGGEWKHPKPYAIEIMVEKAK